VAGLDGAELRGLCYQLFKGDAPHGARAIRTGNPDGGIEWYATLPDGTDWGWQAKHVHDVDSLLDGMTESVRAVVRDRPKLTKLTFLISSNLDTAVSRGRRKSQRQKYDDKVEFWRTSVGGRGRPRLRAHPGERHTRSLGATRARG
jgi:hypothetical protein